MGDIPVIIDKDSAALIQDMKSQVKSAQLKTHRAIKSVNNCSYALFIR